MELKEKAFLGTHHFSCSVFHFGEMVLDGVKQRFFLMIVKGGIKGYIDIHGSV